MVRIMLIIIVLMSAVNCALADTERRLPLKSNEVDVSADIWDFSKTAEAAESPFYKMYGDSLITEILNGIRWWYGVTRDSAYYIGEESRFYKLTPSCAFPTSAFGNMAIPECHNEETSGMYCRTFKIDGHEEYESYPPKRGAMILPTGVEILAVAATECHRTTQAMAQDSLQTAAVEEQQEYIKTRWFSGADRVPIALQCAARTLSNGKEVYSHVSTYVIAGDEPDVPLYKFDGSVQESLERADITVDGNRIRISGAFPDKTVLVLAVSNLTGNCHCRESVPISEGVDDTEVEIPAMPPGEYMLTVSAGTPVSRKVFFRIL